MLFRSKRLHEKASTFTISMADIDMMLNSTPSTNCSEILKEYQDFQSLISEIEAKKLPPHRLIDHTIPLKEGTTTSFAPLYSLSHSELEALRKWLDENLAKGFICTSS